MKKINIYQSSQERDKLRVKTPRILQPLKGSNSFRQSSSEKLQNEKYQQLVNQLGERFPEAKNKINHYFFLLNMFDDIRVDTLMSQFIKIMQVCLKYFDSQVLLLSEIEEKYKVQVQEKDKKLSEYTALLKEKEFIRQSKLKVEERNQFVLKNVQMQKAIEILNSSLKDIKEQDSIIQPALKTQINQQSSLINDQQKVQVESDQLIASFEQQLHFAKRQEKMQINMIKELQIQQQKYEELISQQELEIRKLKAQKNYYYELSQILQEDYFSYKLMIKEKVSNVRQYEDIIKLIQKRVDHLTVLRSKEVLPPFSNRTEEEEIFIARLSKPLESDQTFKKYLMSSLTSENEKQTQEQTMNTSELTKLRLNYPPFQTFLDKKTIDVLLFSIDNQRMSENFMGTLRAIMDGMYKEMQKEYPISFQSYVYSWLSTFQVEYHEVKMIPEQNKNLIQEYINKFYIQLMIPHFEKVWEIIQFKNFLNDVYSYEELYFYLHVRYLLKGIWIEQFDSMYEIINYVKLEKAEQVVHLFLSKYSKQNQYMLIKSLQQASIEVNNNTLVQTGYILQLLLEIFRIDRNQRYKQLCALFPNQQIVSFPKFYKFVEKQYNLYAGQIAELWREVHMISQGFPNVNAFFVASQNLSLKQIAFSHFQQEFTLEQLKEDLINYHGANCNLIERRMLSTYQEQIVKQMDIIQFIKFYGLCNNKEHLLNFINLLLLDEHSQQKMEQMTLVEQNKAATRIQRYFKQKFLHNYLTLYSIISLRLKQIK